MKASVHTRAVGLLTLTLGSLAISTITGHSQTDVPRGSLSVDKDLVRVGTRSNLEWNIEFPTAIKDIVTVEETGTIVPKTNLKMRVRVLGVAFQSGSTLLPLDAYYSMNNGSWEKFFYGTGPTVNSSSVLIDKTVKKSDRIDFGARGWGGSSWLPFNHTRATTKYVTVLGNGSSAPSYAPAYNQNSVTSFLRPYINSAGKITIGERDLIILWESSTASPGSTYFDMQDLVVLVSFE
ncbi:MAG: hypothetical protein NWT08_03285 [Akkermansiaceae bacterium]|jgi:hypothetical protein|nr:hypothetical protein [Akkermansiaceae bacterium]MDP4647816.1 hypothetical protein [Akkermansiaceae bacterium]MDP4721178.1 hypothetical protein [Akkermansiaceae bacterium]MDP4779061.1 hypothetical protein [Akkermansiaceae bacterium]MDP4845918.1 hypothetical protein [Akkermansiaceae bacterium]